MTYRLGAHSTSDDPARYRPDETEEWTRKDPISRFRAWLRASGTLDQAADAALRAAIEAEVRDAIDAEEKVGPPPHRELDRGRVRGADHRAARAARGPAADPRQAVVPRRPLRYKARLNAKGVEMTTDKTRGILLVLGLLTVSATAAGCGGDGNDLAQFTGTWMYTQSMGTLSCQGQPDQSGLLGTSKKWGAGVTSDLVDLTPSLFDSGTQCFYAFDIKDKVATIQAGQSCSFGDGAGGLIDEQPSSWTFTLTGPTAAEEQFMTTIATTCTLTGIATLKKVSASN